MRLGKPVGEVSPSHDLAFSAKDDRDQFGTISHAVESKQLRHMVFHTAFGYPESLADFLVRHSLYQQTKHVLLARRRLPTRRVRGHLTEGTVADADFSRTIR
jgi:hypothetical protein